MDEVHVGPASSESMNKKESGGNAGYEGPDKEPTEDPPGSRNIQCGSLGRAVGLTVRTEPRPEGRHERNALCHARPSALSDLHEMGALANAATRPSARELARTHLPICSGVISATLG